MTSLSERDAAALLEVVADLNRLDDPLPFPPRFMRLLAQLIGTGEANYCVLDRANERLVHDSWWCNGHEHIDGPSEEAGNPYWRLRDSHPVCSYRERTDDWTTPHTASEFVSQPAFRRTAIWDELYRRDRINYWLDVGLPRNEGITRVFIFVRDKHDFDDRERLVLRLLQPHLERHAAEVDARAAAVEALATVEDVGDNAHDIILATTRGTIEFASPRSRTLLARYLHVSNGTLPTRILTGTTVIPDNDSRLTIRTAQVGTIIVLLLGEENMRTDRLTARQREVLARLAAGLTDAEIADQLGIARATVGKHLESIYEQLDVHTRTAAAAAYRG